MKKIIVNATACRTSGGLIILNQFIDNIPYSENLTYIIFVDISYKPQTYKLNVTYVYKDKRRFIKRFLWDMFGLKSYLKKNNIIPIAGISFQNTGFRMNALCPNYIYYHQSIPLYSYKWNPFKSDERIFWFYKNIYPYFVKIFINKKTEVFVQIDYIKDLFCEKYNFDRNKIHIVFPSVDFPKPVFIPQIEIEESNLKLFYPATSLKHKNHALLLKALSSIDNRLTRKITLYLTCKKEDIFFDYDYKNINVFFLGTIAHSQVIWLFNKIDILVFPSYLETLGLPLLEAAALGKQIITVDLPYSREVLEGYNAVSYISHLDANKFGEEILKFTITKNNNSSFYKIKTNSWNYFFKTITQNTYV